MDVSISVKEYGKAEIDSGNTFIDLLKKIEIRNKDRIVCIKVNNELRDLTDKIKDAKEVEYIYFDTDEGKKVYWHSTSHLMAQAVKRLFPEVKLAIGPAISEGFYYDFEVKEPFSPEDLDKIEDEMRKIQKENLPVEKYVLDRKEAEEKFSSEGAKFKQELISGFDDNSFSFYRQAEFDDLCRGPHVSYTGRIKEFSLLSVAGAYWRGDEKREMLQRIYGISFPTKKELKEFLKQREEAKKRDHNKVGRNLDLFMTDEDVGQGLPLIKPRGAKVLQILQRFVEDEEEKRGYFQTKTPFLAKSDLYKVSGHWEHYKDKMFIINSGNEDEELALRPMTCPYQFKIYKSKLRSYRDLPIRYSETSSLFRKETSGEMHGLIRIRQFTISEGHLICTPDQLEEEFRGVINLIEYFMDILGIREDIWFRFSKWDPEKKEKYIDNPAAWQHSQEKMKKILDNLNLDYTEAEDQAAFYGPKLDIQFKNVHGKEDTIITVQIDFALPERFNMVYIDENNEKKHPYVIHRTSIGCYERTLAMLIEKYAGFFPLWLAPEQVRILPVSDKFLEYAESVKKEMLENSIRVTVDASNESLGKKIRNSQTEKVPYSIIVGEKETGNNTINIRRYGEKKQEEIKLKKFIDTLKTKIDNKEK